MEIQNKTKKFNLIMPLFNVINRSVLFNISKTEFINMYNFYLSELLFKNESIAYFDLNGELFKTCNNDNYDESMTAFYYGVGLDFTSSLSSGLPKKKDLTFIERFIEKKLYDLSYEFFMIEFDDEGLNSEQILNSYNLFLSKLSSLSFDVSIGFNNNKRIYHISMEIFDDGMNSTIKKIEDELFNNIETDKNIIH